MYQITYEGGLRTAAIHQKSGTQLITDAPTDNHGKGESFSPTDLVAAALASCMLTIMGINADKKGLDIKGAKAEVHKIMAAHPRRIERVEIQIQMPDNGYSDDEKKLLERVARACPVAKSVHPDLVQAVRFDW
ncbi:MAG: OsmC family protein [Bacteroidota bacterium]